MKKNIYFKKAFFGALAPKNAGLIRQLTELSNKSILLFIFFVLSVNVVFAQRGSANVRDQNVLEVKLGSQLPRNSDWGRTLDRIAGEWTRATNGAVQLRVIHNGLEGNESKMLSSLNSNSIQAALLTSPGMVDICPSIMTLSIPFLLRSETELDLVLKDALPFLESQTHRDFVIIAWSKGGWVYVISKEPVFTPDDLRRQKLSSSPDSKEMNAIFTRMGFQPVETDMADVANKLAGNIINAVYFIPEAIVPLGLHRSLGNILDLPISPFLGAIVMNRITWNKISENHQRELIRITRRITAEFETTALRSSANALRSMQRDGLKVNKPTAAQEELWRAELSRVINPMLGTFFDRDMYQRIMSILDRHRSAR